jgi:uncharacterized membrane protein
MLKLLFGLSAYFFFGAFFTAWFMPRRERYDDVDRALVVFSACIWPIAAMFFLISWTVNAIGSLIIKLSEAIGRR